MILGILILIAVVIVGFVLLIIGVAMSSRHDVRKRQNAQAHLPTPPARTVQPPHDAVSEAPTIRMRAPLVQKAAGPATPRMHPTPSAEAAKTAQAASLELKSNLLYARSAKGSPISSENRDEWLEARRWGVTATDARKLVKLNGQPSVQRASLLEKKLGGARDPDFATFQHGRDREPIIAEWARKEFGMLHNQYIMCRTNSNHLATPDGTGDDFIVEIKTSVKELIPTSKTYRDQLQWQLHVTNSERVLFIVENRHSFQRDCLWITRDENRISTLVNHANRFLDELHARRP